MSQPSYDEKNETACVTMICLVIRRPACVSAVLIAYQSVLLSLFIYFIRIGVDVQFHILISSRPISSHPLFNTSCYLVFKQKVTLNLHGNSSRGFGKQSDLFLLSLCTAK